ncbi:MAG: NnrU family protein [Maritimibacter sp.]|nr:NnrU family protein [Maritimibacter sp.]
MTLLVLGIVLWIFSHSYKRLMPGFRARIGEEPGKGVAALTALAGVVLTVIGYRMAPVVPVYTPIPGMGHLVNLTMLVAIYLLGAGGMNTWVTTKIRHNMLTGALIWAVSHLLVNGDVASILLFGGMALWAVLSMVLIGRAKPWVKPVPKGAKQEVILIVATLALYAVITGIHLWLGYNPFLGTYP